MGIKKVTYLLLVLVVLAAAIPAFAGKAGDEKEIRNIYKIITAAYHNRDGKAAVSRHIHDESLVVFDIVSPFEDLGYKRNLEKATQYINASAGDIIVDYSDVHVTVASPEYAFGTYKVHCVFKDAKDGHVMDVVGRGTHAFKKIKGKWMIIIEHTSVPMDWKMNVK